MLPCVHCHLSERLPCARQSRLPSSFLLDYFQYFVYLLVQLHAMAEEEGQVVIEVGEPLPEQGPLPEQEPLPQQVPEEEEEEEDAWYHANFVMESTGDLVTLRDPEDQATVDELVETLDDLLITGKRAEHGLIPHCTDVRAFYLDHFEYFKVRMLDYGDHSDFVNFYWGQPYSECDQLLKDDLLADFMQKGYFFKYQMQLPSKVPAHWYDYFLVLTKKEFALFYLNRHLTIQYRQGQLLNFHAGSGCLKHAILMCLHSSHDGRHTTDHFVVHLRLSQTLLAELVLSTLATPFNRHYVDYSISLRTDYNMLVDQSEYGFSVIHWQRDFSDYNKVRNEFIADGSLYFDGTFDIPEMVLKVICEDVTMARYRVDLMQKVTDHDRRYLIRNGYFSEAGDFLRYLPSEPVYSARSEGTALSGLPHIQGYQGCITNVNPTINYSGYGGYPDFSYQTPGVVHYQVPQLSMVPPSDTPDSARDDWYREHLPEPHELQLQQAVAAATG